MTRTVRGRGRVRRRRAAVAAVVGIASGLVMVAPAVALDATDIVTTYAGNGSAVGSGDNGPATAAGVPSPVGIIATPDGRLVIPEPNANRVRVVSSAGVITTLAGTGAPGFSGDGGSAVAAQLDGPRDAAIDAAGNIYIADRDNSRIRKITTAGVISTVAGVGTAGFSGDGGAATSAELNNPVGVAVDSTGNIYIADALNRRIRKVAASTGVITTIAGTGASGSTGDGGQATAATFIRPNDVQVTTLGAIVVADSDAHNVRSIDSAGVITTVAGNGTPGNGGDGGPAVGAELATPIEVAIDPFSNLYIADAGSQRVRRVNSAGVISTIAGAGTAGFSGDGGPAGLAKFNAPSGVSLNTVGNLYIGDSGNNRVRVITNPNPFTPLPPVGTPGRLAVPTGSAACNVVPAPAPTKASGKVTLTAQQLLINQRISQAAVRRVNAVQAWFNAGLATQDLCGGAFVAQSFGPTVVLGSTSTLAPGVSSRPNPRPVTPAKATAGNAAGVTLSAQQLLITQRISQAAVRRANALKARLDNGLTGGDLRPGAVTPAKVAVGLTVVSSVAGQDQPPSKTVVAPAGPSAGDANVTLSTTQILINQRIAQAAVRRSNALIARIGGGFSAADFQASTLSRRTLGAGF